MDKSNAIKLLVIDDKPDNLTTLRAMVLEAFPKTLVLTATNGPAGIELAAAEDPDVILLDIVMPGMDGFEVCRRLKADDRLKDIPVVFLTALKTDTVSRVKALEVGGDGFLSKPLETAELTAQIRAMTKVKVANRSQRTEKGYLEALVAKRTAELQVHQIELEMQNEELQQARAYVDALLAQYTDLYDFAPTGYLSLDRAGAILRVNLTGALLFGVERSRLDNRRFGQFVAGSDRRAFNDFLEKVFASEAKTSCEVTLSKEGSQPLVVRLEGRRSEDGQECRAAVLDITARKQAEAALRVSAELLSRSQEIAHIGSWKLDLTANSLIWTDEVYRIFGCEPQEFAPTYEAFLDCVHPEDRAAVDEAYSRSVRDGSGGYDMEHRIVRRNSDEVRYVHERCVHERDAAGTIIQSTGMVQDITERKQAEEALLESEERVRSIFASMTEIVVLHELVCDEDGRPVNYRIIDCNPAFTQITGIRHDDAVGRLATDVYGSDTAPYLDEYARVALTGEPCVFIAAYAPMDKHFDIHASRPGKNRFVTVTTDITSRKRAEESLRISQERLQLATHGTGIGIWDWDIVKDDLVFDDSMLRLYGIEKEIFGGVYEAWASRLHPDDKKNAEGEIQAALRGDREYSSEFRIVLPDGSVRFISVASQTFRDDQGKPVRMIGVNIDITERKRAEAKLLELRMAVEQSGDGIALADMDGYIIFVNKAWAAMHGYAAEELIRRHLSMFHTPEQLEKEVIPFNERLISTGAETGEMGHCRKDGTTFPTHMTVTVAKDATGTPFGLLSAAQDITERKQAENYREMGQEILQILTEPGDLQESIPRVLDALKTRIGFDAVGLRLQEGEDFPYFAQDGFSQDFLLTENTLVIRGKDGGVCRDKDGNVCLECTCGLVISGKTDPFNPLFTKGGSCWTNDSLPLLDLPSDQDPRLHPRNNCIHQGYASVALIPVRIQEQMHSRETCIRKGFSSIAQVPVRTSDRIVGLIQLNDKRKGRFTLETIEILEGIAAHIGAALMRKRADEQRQEGFDLLYNLARLVPGVLYQYRLYPDGRSVFPYSSPGMFDIYEATPEEVREDASVVFKRLHPEDHERVAEAIFESARTLNTFHCEFRVVLPRQGLRWRWSQAHPERTEDGGTLWHGTILDITERKQAEQELVRLSTAIEQSAEVVVITDAQGTIQYVNPAFTQISGYTREEAIGQSPRILKSGKQDAAFYRRMWAALTAGEVFVCRMVNRRKDGTLYTEEATISPVKDASGRILNYVAVKRDITEHLRKEEERAELQSQLNQAQKMESVGRLAGGVAHDFNNLLMGIMGYTELCQEQIAPDHPVREYLDEITHGAERSAEITRQLLAFARKQTIAPKVLDLNDAVGGMLKLLRQLVGEDVKLTWRPGSDLQRVKLDPAQVDQILANLCVNARDAIAGVGEIVMETGSVVIGADLCAQYPEAIPGEYVCLVVSDNGCGMDQETLAQVFEPFFTTKGVGKGTGLGLATVYGIVKQNNGFIYAYSEPDRGTTFRIFLPAIAAKDAAPAIGHAAPAGRGETVLVVEDNLSVRKTCGRFLEALGYKAMEAETPEEALVIAKRYGGDIHLVLTDVVMPGMDGRQLAQRISAVKPGVKVVFMSGYTSDVIAQRGVVDEGVQFLSKPFTRDALARKVREVLEAD